MREVKGKLNAKIKKKKQKPSSSSSSDSSSSDSESSSSDSSPKEKRRKKKKKYTSSSEDSEKEALRRKLKKIRQKGKLKSGRVRTGLPVVRDQDWPYESLNFILAGKKFDAENLSEPAFIAGILNSVVKGDEFKSLEKKGPTEMLQKIKVLNELAHTLVRVNTTLRSGTSTMQL